MAFIYGAFVACVRRHEADTRRPQTVQFITRLQHPYLNALFWNGREIVISHSHHKKECNTTFPSELMSSRPIQIRLIIARRKRRSAPLHASLTMAIVVFLLILRVYLSEIG